MNGRKAMFLALVAIALSFVTIAPSMGQNIANAASDRNKEETNVLAFSDKNSPPVLAQDLYKVYTVYCDDYALSMTRPCSGTVLAVNGNSITNVAAPVTYYSIAKCWSGSNYCAYFDWQASGYAKYFKHTDGKNYYWKKGTVYAKVGTQTTNIQNWVDYDASPKMTVKNAPRGSAASIISIYNYETADGSKVLTYIISQEITKGFS